MEDAQRQERWTRAQGMEFSKTESNLKARLKQLEMEKEEGNNLMSQKTAELNEMRSKQMQTFSEMTDIKLELVASKDRYEELQRLQADEINKLKFGRAKEKADLQCEVNNLNTQLQGNFILLHLLHFHSHLRVSK